MTSLVKKGCHYNRKLTAWHSNLSQIIYYSINYLLLYEQNWVTEGTDVLAEEKTAASAEKKLHQTARSEK